MMRLSFESQRSLRRQAEGRMQMGGIIYLVGLVVVVLAVLSLIGLS
jgi:hypothetical protein